MKRLLATVTLVASAAGFTLGPAVEAEAATPSCDKGYVCTWTERNGGGILHKYSHTANHTHAIQSVHFNYNSWNTMFTTAFNGRGKVLAAYYTSQRGFRNWDPSNRWACKSHRDFR